MSAEPSAIASACFDSSAVGVAWLDATLRYVRVNDTFARIATHIDSALASVLERARDERRPVLNAPIDPRVRADVFPVFSTTGTMESSLVVVVDSASSEGDSALLAALRVGVLLTEVSTALIDVKQGDTSA